MKQWVHLAAVFQRPHITTYVNGKKVGSATWDYPVGQRGDMEVGRWSGATCHRGLIDEVRIYRRRGCRRGAGSGQSGWPARPRLPGRSARPKSTAKELLRLETRWATMVVGDNGTILSLLEKGSGRELLAAPQPVLAVEQAPGRRLQARRWRPGGRAADGRFSSRRRRRRDSDRGQGSVLHRDGRGARCA